MPSNDPSNSGGGGSSSSSSCNPKSNNVLKDIVKSIKLPGLSPDNTKSPLPLPSPLYFGGLLGATSDNSSDKYPTAERITDLSSSSSSSTSSNILQDIMSLSATDYINKIGSKLDEMMSNYLTALTLGAVLGAAITSGVLFGVFAASGVVNGIRSLPRFGTLWKKRSETNDYRHRRSRLRKQNDDRDYDSDISGDSTHESLQRSRRMANGVTTDLDDNETTISQIDIGRGGILTIIRGDVKSSRVDPQNSTEQCQYCLNNLGVTLKKNGLVWNNIKRLTVYLVSDRCTASEFRQVCKEYPFSTRHAIMTIVFVSRLEDDNAVVQVEALVTNRNR